MKNINFKFIKLIFSLILIFISLKFTLNCHSSRSQSSFRPIMTRIEEGDVSPGRSEESYENIRVAVDWSLFNNTIKDTNQVFAKALRNEIVPRTITVFEKLIKVRRLIHTLKFPEVFKCERYDVPGYLRTTGVEQKDIVIFPIIEESGEFIKERIEAAALYCSQSTLDGRPLMGFIEYRPDLLAGDEYHLDYHIWLSIHELMHVFAFNDSLFPYFINPITGKKLGVENVMQKHTVNGMDMNFVISKKVKELARKHFGCPDAIGVPLENKGSEGSKDGHWNRKAMNGDVMLAKSFGENLISDITLALFEDSGWYKINYDLSNVFFWGKDKGCDFLMCKDCFEQREVNTATGTYKIKSKYPREFCSNFNNPVCSTHNIFRGSCYVRDDITRMSTNIKVNPFTQNSFGGSDSYMDYCPSAMEDKGSQTYYGGSCRVGNTIQINSHEKLCPNCACVITDLDPKKVNDVAKKKKYKIRMGQSVYDSYANNVIFKKSQHLKASCLEYNCVNNKLYIDIMDQSYLCNKKYIRIAGMGIIKCPLKSMICHKKYKCKFGCVEHYHTRRK
jgi:hypothetical protein